MASTKDVFLSQFIPKAQKTILKWDVEKQTAFLSAFTNSQLSKGGSRFWVCMQVNQNYLLTLFGKDGTPISFQIEGTNNLRAIVRSIPGYSTWSTIGDTNCCVHSSPVVANEKPVASNSFCNAQGNMPNLWK